MPISKWRVLIGGICGIPLFIRGEICTNTKNDQLEKRGAVIGGVINPALTLISILHYFNCNLHIVEPGGKSISTEVWDIVF